MAFKIIAVGEDIDGSGSVLPELEIEVVNPSDISPEDMGHIGTTSGGGGGSLRLVQ